MDAHEQFQQLAALRLYGELDAGELERLERHLAQCSACSALALDLGSGLGRLAPVSTAADLPGEWKSGLAAAIAADGEPPLPSVPRSTFWVAAASFLVGAVLAWSVASNRAQGPWLGVEERGGAPSPSSASFQRSTPPPRARDAASLPPLAELYLRR